MLKVLGIGNALTDIVVQLKNEDALVEFGFPKGSMQLIDERSYLKVLNFSSGHERNIKGGGSAANTIFTLSKLGVETGFIGKIKDDEIGMRYRSDLETNGIRPYLSLDPSPSGCSVCLVSPDSERTMATFLGAAASLTAKDLNPEIFKNYDILYVEGYLVQNYELIEEAMKMASEAGMQIALDLASYNVVELHLDFLKKLVDQYIDILFANEEEAFAFTGKNPEDALHELSAKCALVIIKTGKKGSIANYKGHTYSFNSEEAKVVDTTGAGDNYSAGFLYSIISDQDIKTAGATASFLASKVIEGYGGRIEDEKWDDVLSYLRKQIQ